MGSDGNEPGEPQVKLYSAEEVAKITDKTLTTVYAWIRSGKLKTSQPGGRKGKHMISQAALDDLLAPTTAAIARATVVGKAAS